MKITHNHKATIQLEPDDKPVIVRKFVGETVEAKYRLRPGQPGDPGTSVVVEYTDFDAQVDIQEQPDD